MKMIKDLQISIVKWSIWKRVQFILAGCIFILLVAIAVQIIIAVNMHNQEKFVMENSGFAMLKEGNGLQTVISQTGSISNKDFGYRSGLFKPSDGVRDRPIADKTIERITSQLKLQCIMEINGEMTAYISIEGLGLKKCCIGEKVGDIFTVVKIDKKNKCADVSIIGHKVRLSL